jgi:transcriptional regulator with XRE-family HTH domain
MIAVQRSHRPVGELLRPWRQRRRLSQLALALEAEISTRHLSFIETGRSRPSREMILRLAEQLDVPLRERNQLLLAAGYAPVYAETALDSPSMTAVRAAVRQVLAGHAAGTWSMPTPRSGYSPRGWRGSCWRPRSTRCG